MMAGKVFTYTRFVLSTFHTNNIDKMMLNMLFSPTLLAKTTLEVMLKLLVLSNANTAKQC